MNPRTYPSNTRSVTGRFRTAGILVTLLAAMLSAGACSSGSAAARSSDASLATLSSDTGTLSPAFAADTLAYSLEIGGDISTVTLSATASDARSALAWSPSQTVTAADGATIAITVTAEDGTTTTYTVEIEQSSDYVSANVGTLKYVPAGSFQRDSTAGDITVITAGYHVGQTAVTRAQFQAVMGYDPVTTAVTGYTTTSAGPTHNMNWYVAIAFCNKLSLLEGLTPAYSVSGITDWANLTVASIPTAADTNWDAATCNWTASGYRLPTEAEYHWAAMGAQGDYTKSFAGSNGTNLIGDYCWFRDNCYDTTTLTYTWPDVGTKLPNELGLYDMNGCAYAWGWDWKDVRPSGTLTDYRGASTSTSGRARLGAAPTTPLAYVLACPDETHRLARLQYSALATLGIRLVRN